MCLSLLAGVVFAYSPRGIAEPDIWWHILEARYLFQNRSLPPLNTSTFTNFGSPILNLEWLAEIPYSIGFDLMGWRGVLLVYEIALILIFVGVYYRSYRAADNCKNAVIATLIAICFAGVSMAPRTLLFGWLCMVGLLLVLDHFRETGRGIWLLPFLFAVWINLHGSWIFGVVVFALILGSGLVEGEWDLVVARRWRPVELKKLLLAFASSLIALLLNPYGFKLVLYPAFLLTHQQTIMQNLDEWQPVNFSQWNGKLALMLIFALLAALLFSRRKWRLDEVLLTVFALWAALSHCRFLFFLGLVVAPILAPYLNFFSPYEREIDKPWLNACIIAVVLGCVIFFFPSTDQLNQTMDATFPAKAVQYIKQQNIKGRVFNQYAWGGYLEWHAPELPIFIDGRADVFLHNGVFEDFLRATTLADSFGVFDKYKIDYALVAPSQPLTYLLQHSPAWRPIYSDSNSILFKRTP
jgi:hypothetical protein